MIDGIRGRRHVTTMHPRDQEMVSRAVVGAHADRPPAASTSAKPPTEPAAPFKSPESIATEEESQPTTATTGPLAPKDPPKRRSFKAWLTSRTKKQWIIYGIVALLILGGAGVGAFYLFKTDAKPAPKPVVAQKKKEPEPVKPVLVASNLTGLPVDPAVNERPVTGIMIENSPDARPQSGLQYAGAIFEAIAEGGITRFLTLYQDFEPDYIGPVRSVRPYYVQWAMGFDAPVAHVGGSADGVALVRKGKDLDQFAGGSYFWRIPTRQAPHNVYTSMQKLREYETARGYGKSVFNSYLRKDEKAAKTPTATSIDFSISGSFYNAHYDYDPASNAYLRSEGGAPHMAVDQNGGTVRLAPKVVVGLVFPQGSNGVYTTYQTIGGGTAFVFQDGIVTEGVWHKDANNGNFFFTTSTGGALPLDAGQVWFTAVGGSDRVTYH